MKGDFTFKFHENGRSYELSTNTVTSLGITLTAKGGTAAVLGTATLRDVTTPSAPAIVDDAAPLIVVATDASEPSSSDSLAVTLYKKSGGLWLATSWNGISATAQPVINGNIAIR